MLKGRIQPEHFQEIAEKMKEGLFPQWVITDPEIYDMEIEYIFSRTWQFLAHESEIPKPGDYVTRWIAHDPILLVRTQNGEIKGYYNSCTHRGAMLCTADCGNRKTFTCPYHGWTYNLEGELVGITLGNIVYGEELKKEDWGLRPIPKLETYHGMIFGNLNEDSEPLTEYLGGMCWYLDLLVGRSEKGMEVKGAPHRWVVQANWKITYENFAGDPYHVLTTHASTVEVGITPSRGELPEREGYHVVLTNGHGMNLSLFKEIPKRPYLGLPENLWPEIEHILSPVQRDFLARAHIFVGGVYPTLSFVVAPHGAEGVHQPFLNFRVWRPLAPDRVEIWSWLFVDKDAPEEYKNWAYRCYIASFGASGTLEQDDTENWARIVQASRGIRARNKHLSYNNVCNYLMGYNRVQPLDNYPGPGIAYDGFVDMVSRSIHQRWLELMMQGLCLKERVSL